MRLEIKDLRVAYGKIEALKGISITVNPEIVFNRVVLPAPLAPIRETISP